MRRAVTVRAPRASRRGSGRVSWGNDSGDSDGGDGVRCSARRGRGTGEAAAGASPDERVLRPPRLPARLAAYSVDRWLRALPAPHPGAVAQRNAARQGHGHEKGG